MLWDVLEDRRLLSGAPGPVIVGLQLTGSVRAVTGVVVTFNESLDPAAAQDTQAYAFGRMLTKKDDSVGIGDILPFLSRPRVRAVKAGRVQIASAVYDDATHSVTLHPVAPFNANKFFKFFRASGQGTHG